MRGFTFVPSLHFPNALTWLAWALGVYLYSSPPADLDFCWQIRTGEHILQTGEVPPRDSFSYTIAGQRIPDHEWLYEVGLAFGFRYLDHPGMKLGRVLLFAAPLIVLAWQLKARGVASHGIVLTVLACGLIFISFERLRPMVFSTLGLQLVSGWLSDHVRNRKPLDLRLPWVMFLWGNLHPAVIMGQALLLGAIAFEGLSCLCGRADPQMVRRLTWWGGLGFTASLVAPDPMGRFLYPFASELRHPAQQLFREIRPPWSYLGQPPFVIEFALLLGVALTIVLWQNRRDFRLWEGALLLGTAGLAATATRGVIDWIVITSAYAVPRMAPQLRSWVALRSLTSRWVLRFERLAKRLFSGPLLKPQPRWLGVGLLVLAAFTMSPWSVLTPNVENRLWPRQACDWIAAGNLPTAPPWNIFSGSDEGSYLLWRLPGKARVYTDTRGFFYPGELLLDSYYLPGADRDWPRRWERVLSYGTQYLLLRVDSPWWSILEIHGATPLYRDGQHVLLTSEQVQEAVESWKHRPSLAAGR